MRKRTLILIILLAAGLLLLLANASASKPALPFKAMFCPESWEYLWGDGSLDRKGNCATCGKYPVELEVRSATWWWCNREHRWLEAPCAGNAPRSCCTGAESLALALPFASDVMAAAYCPGDQAFKTVALPLVGTRICAACGGPALQVLAVTRAWFWCESEGVWAAEACPMNPVRRCCVKREGLLLTTIVPAPYAKK